jgi:hypothetical protein
MAPEQTLEFLWKLFCLHLAEVSNEVLDKHISTLYAAVLDLDGTFETFIDGYASNHDRKFLDMAVIEAVRQRSFNTHRHVQLVAAVVGKGLISLDTGSSLLTVRGSNLEELPKAVKHALDVAWLINQDKRDGFMGADDDHLLKDALANVALDWQNSLSIADQHAVMRPCTER